jgi:beta-galactosidase
VRCGFREFRFENGYFRLNGRRIFPRGPLNLILYPVGFTVPPDPDYLRRDVLAMKMMGMNICRACFGGMTARQLDVYDELGVMVYMENYGSWLMEDSPNLEKWFDRALAEIIVRDRNHPSVVAWRRGLGAVERNAGRAVVPPRGRHPAAGPVFRRQPHGFPLQRPLGQ